MVHEIREKNLFTVLKNSAREIGYRTLFSYAFLTFFVVVIAITFLVSQTRKNLIQSASYDESTRTFTESFDGNPANPQPITQIGQNVWDIQVHSRDRDTWENLEEMDAMHGTDCSAPPASHHLTGNYNDAVFNCRNHLMTSLNAGGYGVIYLTPNQIFDFANGGSITFDLSTERMSRRDWWDLLITPYDENMSLPLLSNLSQGTDLWGSPNNVIHVGTDNGEGAPTLTTVVNGNETGYNEVWEFTPANANIPSTVNQMATRQTFKFTIANGRMKFERLESATAPYVLFFDKAATVPFTSGIVQFGHHAYNPTKDDSGVPATWHWDNVIITPATPFTMVKANKRFVDGDNQTVTFNQPAPANAYLRFSAICKVKLDGIVVNRVPAYDRWGMSINHPEHMSSYFVPIAQGKQVVNFSFTDDSWYTINNGCFAKDFAIWSRSGSSQIPTVIPTTIPSPTVTQSVPTPTNTPTPLTPTPTKTPTPTPIPPTPTPTPTKTPTPTPIPPTPTPTPPTPTPTKTQAQKADLNNSGKVDVQDLSFLLTRWNSNDLTADLNGDGKVGTFDLSVLLSNWGK